MYRLHHHCPVSLTDVNLLQLEYIFKRRASQEVKEKIFVSQRMTYGDSHGCRLSGCNERKYSTEKKFNGRATSRRIPTFNKKSLTCFIPLAYLPLCASDLAFADIVHVYKFHLLTYLLTYFNLAKSENTVV